jgi:hypothetical protein
VTVSENKPLAFEPAGVRNRYFEEKGAEAGGIADDQAGGPEPNGGGEPTGPRVRRGSPGGQERRREEVVHEDGAAGRDVADVVRAVSTLDYFHPPLRACLYVTDKGRGVWGTDTPDSDLELRLLGFRGC